MTTHVTIDRDLCAGSEVCCGLYPEAFALDEHGVAVVVASDGVLDPDRAQRAVDSCPMQALALTRDRPTPDDA